MASNAKTSTKEPKETKPGEDDAQAKEARVRAIAMQHALSIEEKKKLQTRVLDTIVVAFDLPSDTSATAAQPTDADANTFRESLALLRPSDLDEVASERNIDNRCGYALCPNSTGPQRSTKVWDTKTGRLVDKTVDGKYCSKDCKERNLFVRQQLSTEPAWLRHETSTRIQLLTDNPSKPSFAHSEDSSKTQEKIKQETLALERGDTSKKSLDDIPIFEKETTSDPGPPKYSPEITVGDILEGLPIRTIGTGKAAQKS